MQAGRITKFTYNNFDLIRLFAALQVAITHAAVHLGVEGAWLRVLEYFPGVPIFFFISGFLIYQSYANLGSNRLRIFFTNRFLRLYPGLWLCLLLSIAMVALAGYWREASFGAGGFAAWLIAQATFFQFFNPDFLRDYGVGSLNGSLWTICVELQFYLLTPLIFVAFQRFRRASIILFFLLVLVNAFNTHFNARTEIVGKLIYVSFMPWIAMFLLGAYASTSEGLRNAILRINVLWLIGAYLTAYELSRRFGLGVGNGINMVTFALLAALTLKCAYSRPDAASRILQRNDISYGVYIYHMPVVNFFFEKGLLLNSLFGVILALAATITLGTLSWIMVERPALRLKQATLRSDMKAVDLPPNTQRQAT